MYTNLTSKPFGGIRGRRIRSGDFTEPQIALMEYGVLQNREEFRGDLFPVGYSVA
jgi:hypothetical protein